MPTLPALSASRAAAGDAAAAPFFPRRSFIKGILAAGAFPFVAKAATPFSWGANKGASAPSQKVRIAYIGIGNQGASDIGALDRTGLTEVVALCDTEIGHKRTQGTLKKHPDAARFRDFRELFDKKGKEFDAVLVATPDFSHFPAAILALSQGKHVFVEKPVSHTFDQIERLIAAEKKYKTSTGGALVTQMGNQGHSSANYYQFREWTQAGLLDGVTKIVAHMNSARRWHWTIKKNWRHLDAFLPKQDVPAWLDWEAWLATAGGHDFNAGYLSGEWRSWFDFGNGALGDWGAHIFDTAHEFLRLGLPTAVTAVKLEGRNPFVYPQASTLRFQFAARDAADPKKFPAVELLWYDGQKNIPKLPKTAVAVEEDKSIPKSGGGSDKRAAKAPAPGKEIYTAGGAIFQGASHGSVLKVIESGKTGISKNAADLPQYRKDKPDAHYKGFLTAIITGGKTTSPFHVSGPLCQTMALGVIAQRVAKEGETLAFDPVAKRITNNDAANALLTHVPPRAGWEQFYKM
ncbi:MAG: Gfo/Idh/MocA family oxidoreductase [Puniceicoccales bacterium]|jgi:predicted dehydrogenase|nr:Gfo/Idh/MocA family oxidoreductase [Puniceicoccales bacterium]